MSLIFSLTEKGIVKPSLSSFTAQPDRNNRESRFSFLSREMVNELLLTLWIKVFATVVWCILKAKLEMEQVLGWEQSRTFQGLLHSRGRSECNSAVVFGCSDPYADVLNLQIHPQMFHIACLKRSCCQRKATLKNKYRRKKGALRWYFQAKKQSVKEVCTYTPFTVIRKVEIIPSHNDFFLDTWNSGFIFLPECIFYYFQNLFLSYIV